MKPEELMIGDWVLMKDKPYKVASLSSIGNPELEGDKYIFHCLKDEIAPIPLTPEILEKNGFNLSRDKSGIGILDTYWLGEGIDFRLHSFETDYYQFGLAKIRYVHQLQHALRLCGIEKEIEI